MPFAAVILVLVVKAFIIHRFPFMSSSLSHICIMCGTIYLYTKNHIECPMPFRFIIRNIRCVCVCVFTKINRCLCSCEFQSTWIQWNFWPFKREKEKNNNNNTQYISNIIIIMKYKYNSTRPILLCECVMCIHSDMRDMCHLYLAIATNNSIFFCLLFS